MKSGLYTQEVQCTPSGGNTDLHRDVSHSNSFEKTSQNQQGIRNKMSSSPLVGNSGHNAGDRFVKVLRGRTGYQEFCVQLNCSSEVEASSKPG